MSAQPISFTYLTECQICHKGQRLPPLQIPATGTPPKETRAAMEKLLMHIVKNHGEQIKQGQNLLEQYQTFLLLSQFNSEDPALQRVFEGMRADIFQRCRRNVPTDEELAILKAGCNFENEADAQKAYDAMRAIRDLCCELGAAAPKTEPSVTLHR